MCISRVLPRMWGAAVLAAVLVACGGGSDSSLDTGADAAAPVATVDIAAGALPQDQPLTVRFSKSMDTTSARLGGEIGSVAQVAWTRSNAESDTLTLKPPTSGWPRGDGRQLTVDAKDTAGRPIATLDSTYVVPLRFDVFPSAVEVVGQADFLGSSANRGGTTAADGFDTPIGPVATTRDGRLLVADNLNSRLLSFAGSPANFPASADFALGQPGFTSANYGTSRSEFVGVQGPSVAGGKLLFTDIGSNRVVIYNTIPDDGSALVDVVLGQPDYNSSIPACLPATFNQPESAVLTEDGKVLVADSGNNRVLIWNRVPLRNGVPPDLVLGQSDGQHCAWNDDDQDGHVDANPSQRTLAYPSGVWSDGTRIAVVDETNNRILIWSTFPKISFQPADVVLGQGSFTSSSANDDDQDGDSDLAPTARTLSNPYVGIASNGVQLAVADLDNHRVLVWNTFPTASFQPADAVIGHSGFAQYHANDLNEDRARDPTASSRTFDQPAGVHFRGDRLFVTDAGNNRILVFRAR